MAKVLLILEVSQKQAYIFSGKGLKDNIARSANIARVTSDAWFREKAGGLYNTDKNLVYSGGGHTVLQFPCREDARAFATCITGAALREYPGMEMFATITDYDPAKTPAENLKANTDALEKKKSLRAASFRYMSLGVEALNQENWQPGSYPEAGTVQDILPAEEGWCFPRDFKRVIGKDNFLAIVHADGNAMGTKAAEKTEKYGPDQWEDCCAALRDFSSDIDNKFRKALKAVADAVMAEVWNTAEQDESGNRILPMRPIIQAGDDVCFVCAGNLGLSCAETFLKALEADTTGGTEYHACAGVAMVHASYPFAKAYELSEELCSSAKKLGSAIDPKGRVAAMDWHIEFGQLQDSLSDTRRDYITEDGCQLSLRPVTLVVPPDAAETAEALTGGVRTWDFVRALIQAYQDREAGIPRGKLKNLRAALKQGQVETRYYLADKQIAQVLDKFFDAKYQTDEAKLKQWRLMLAGEKGADYNAFPVVADAKRCLLFDAIEMTDHFERLEAGKDE